MTAILVIAATVLATLAIHETGHALVLHRQGIPITEAGLGLGLPPRLRIRAAGITWSIDPWLLGAYVAPHPDDHQRMEAMPYRDAAWHLNAGVIVNLTAGFALIAVGSAADHGIGWKPAIIAALAAATWLGRRQVAAYLLPALALPALAFTLWSLAGAWSHGQSGLGLSGLGALAPHDFVGWLRFAGALNVAVAVFNTLPLSPLDNGKVVGRLLQVWPGGRAVSVYRVAGLVVVLAALAGSVLSDAWAALS